MAIYKFNLGKINGVTMNHLPMIMTNTGTKIFIRIAGEVTPFIEADLSEFVDEDGDPFASVSAFVTYWNTYYITTINVNVISQP